MTATQPNAIDDAESMLRKTLKSLGVRKEALEAESEA
eukprot:CAMPEP_0198124278 /NCGR_PEP_ID=MMETSP1442-20131203/39578_1 /TAXON_ID= /ORGANISM="Craspedostauros australis, Strain CCMP3328" /LENGTH=36 /DNA_ID= /DNA_START= /DNA_END= /DNA_ORIENTATION=